MNYLNKKFNDGNLEVYYHNKDDLKFNFIFTDNCNDVYSLVDSNSNSDNDFLIYCFNSIYNNNKEYEFNIQNYKYNSDNIDLLIVKSNNKLTIKTFKLYRNTFTKDKINNLKYKYLNLLEKNNKLIKNNTLLYIYIFLLFYMISNNYDITYSLLFLLLI